MQMGAGNMIYTDAYASPIGTIWLASDGAFLVGAWFEGQKYFPEAFPEFVHQETEVISRAKQWLDRYFASLAPDPRELPLAPAGSTFRQQVWSLLMDIPYGTTVTYGQIAARLTRENHMSAQAVGGAVGHNPISIIIPCHRVLGADGSLTGYAGGVERKQFLLGLEMNGTHQS